MKSALTFPVPVSFDSYDALASYMEEVRCTLDISSVISMAINDWIAASRKRSAEPPARKVEGYLWKELFLPAGTRLRTKAMGQVTWALVQGSAVMCEGRRVSPNEFANGLGCARRSAWKSIWIKLPYEEQWVLASELRKRPKYRKPYAYS